jgi:hypothetical protein
MKVSPELEAHRQWLGQIGQVGLVVSPAVLVKHGVVIDRQRAVEVQTTLTELSSDDEHARVADPLAIFRGVLGWRDDFLAGTSIGPDLPDTLVVVLPEHEDHLRPTYAIRDPERPDGWLLLVETVDADDFDKAPAPDAHRGGWRASPHARLERLLRETAIPIGILINGVSLRLVYAPKGESSGYLTFHFRYLVETHGRPMAGALAALLAVERVTDLLPAAQRLPALLEESRKYQNDVSTALAGQVLEALWELVRGFQTANDAAARQLLAQALREAPHDIYGGLLTTLMRLVFILYAEDRGLVPAGDVYQRHYSVAGLFERLREDEARYPDTMDARYGAWTQLLALFRLIHDGGGHGALKFTARLGRLFDPDAYPFLEGRAHDARRVKGERVDPPRVADGVVYRVLRNLLILDGERLSYRALDVEQIGSVYEAMMGFALEEARGPSIAVAPKHIVVNIADLLERPGSDRAKWLRDEAELKLSSADALAKAKNADEVMNALAKKVSRYTPRVVPVGALYLQPTEERRRSGSHYTPRSLTQPIVATTFGPILQRFGDQATPQQILDLKVCDPAMGSGAFLVESCRLLADQLVKAWAIHGRSEALPPDEDELTLAKRLIAERCLYGVDKNVFAVDLAKLSLWLATLAREHPFTFLDHALRHGDSLVGLSREQIACFNWESEKQLPFVRGLIDERVAEAQRLREQIQGLATSDDVPQKARLLRDAEHALEDVRIIGNLVVSAFFEREKPKDRKTLRTAYAGQVQDWLTADSSVAASQREPLAAIAQALRQHEHPIPPFHWQIEFPEVFTRAKAGFDVVVGNPPFMGGVKISGALGVPYLDHLHGQYEHSGGQADLVAFFFRRAFGLLSVDGAFGLVATNTVAQGDTRESGLTPLLTAGGVLYAARRRVRWPGLAAVIVSVVHVAKGVFAGRVQLDESVVPRISAFLLVGNVDSTPLPLNDHPGKRSFLGSMVAGVGFTFDDDNEQATSLAEMNSLIATDKRNLQKIYPFVGGEEINSSPTHSSRRWIIDFDGMTFEEASAWPELLEIVRRKVKPYRDHVNRDAHRLKWWQYGDRRVELYETIQRMKRVLAISQVSPHLAFAFLPSRMVFSHAVDVFAFDSDTAFAVLQSRSHELWARFLGSTMKDDLRYAPSDCFETFPFPPDWPSAPGLERVGREYYEFRSALMIDTKEGLTSTYNRFHDPNETRPRIVRLRELHDAMDRAVLDAYGWTDIRPSCEFLLDYEIDEEEWGNKRKPYRYRWPDDVRDEVLGRLLALNADRAAAERLAGPASPGPTSKRKKAKAANPSLLDESV